jgi:predicted transcriptional regulator
MEKEYSKKKKECSYCQQALHTDRELMQLMHLRNCRISTDKGLIDQGFPTYMKEMAVNRWVRAVGKGYVITDEGRAFERLHERWFEKN